MAFGNHPCLPPVNLALSEDRRRDSACCCQVVRFARCSRYVVDPIFVFTLCLTDLETKASCRSSALWVAPPTAQLSGETFLSLYKKTCTVRTLNNIPNCLHHSVLRAQSLMGESPNAATVGVSEWRTTLQAHSGVFTPGASWF